MGVLLLQRGYIRRTGGGTRANIPPVQTRFFVLLRVAPVLVPLRVAPVLALLRVAPVLAPLRVAPVLVLLRVAPILVRADIGRGVFCRRVVAAAGARVGAV